MAEVVTGKPTPEAVPGRVSGPVSSPAWEPAPGKDLIVRACASTYAVMGGIWAVLFVFWLGLSLRGVPNGWMATAITGSALGLVLVWSARFQIRISAGTLSYRSLLGGTRSLHLSELEEAEIRFRTVRYGRIPELVLWTEASSRKAPIVINMKVFGKGDLNLVFDALGPKLRTRNFSPTGFHR
jgi:hypothetical protein